MHEVQVVGTPRAAPRPARERVHAAWHADWRCAAGGAGGRAAGRVRDGGVPRAGLSHCRHSVTDRRALSVALRRRARGRHAHPSECGRQGARAACCVRACVCTPPQPHTRAAAPPAAGHPARPPRGRHTRKRARCLERGQPRTPRAQTRCMPPACGLRARSAPRARGGCAPARTSCVSEIGCHRAPPGTRSWQRVQLGRPHARHTVRTHGQA